MMSSKLIESEIKHLSLCNKFFVYLLSFHILVAMATAYFFDTGVTFALVASLIICSAPFTFTFFKLPRLAATTNAIALMFFSGLLIHHSKGMIEFHFHVFTSLAMLIVFASPKILLTGTVTIALHHIGFYFIFPKSLFNYEASFGVVILHAAFVIYETIPCLWISNKFRSYIIDQGEIVAKIEDTYESINDSILQLTTNNEELNVSSQQQTVSVNKSNKSIQDISSLAEHTKENAVESKQISSQTKLSADHGIDIVNSVNESMEKIKENQNELIQEFGKNKSDFASILDSIKQIETKTKIINEIVFQTKLLSFNASIEAARAGEHGKGFSVVAEEIGNLAQTSGLASHEITEIINSSVQKVQEMTAATERKMNELMQRTEKITMEGEEKMRLCGDTFNDLSTYIENLNQRVNEISQDSEKQNQEVQEMLQIIHELQSANTRNGQTLIKSLQVSDDLLELSHNFGDMVQILKTGNQHKKAS